MSAKVWAYIAFNSLALILVSCDQQTVATTQSHKASVTEHKIQHRPITVSAACTGNFAEGASWYLSVNSARQAELIIGFDNTRRLFQITEDQWADIRKMLSKEQFFDLADSYGDLVPDGSTRTLTVTVGDETKTIQIHYLMNNLQAPASELREVSRALRAMALIRGWFPDVGAVDLRPYDQRVLDAAER